MLDFQCSLFVIRCSRTYSVKLVDIFAVFEREFFLQAAHSLLVNDLLLCALFFRLRFRFEPPLRNLGVVHLFVSLRFKHRVAVFVQVDDLAATLSQRI